MNITGLCIQGGHWVFPNYPEYIVKIMTAVTGWDLSAEELNECADRAATIRHAFNLREGINPLNYKVNSRIVGDPPQQEGPHAGITSDVKGEILWNLGALDWERTGCRPSKNKLLKLKLNDVADDLWADADGPVSIAPKMKKDD